MILKSVFCRSAIRATVRGIQVLVALCCGLFLIGGANAEQVRELAKTDNWVLVMVEDPFAEISRQCQIRTRTIESGGRRERPLIIFDLTSRRIAVRPDKTLQGSVLANRAFQGGTGDRGGSHTVRVDHGMRVDGGQRHIVRTEEDGAGNLEVYFDGGVFTALADEVSNGTVLHYLWAVATSRKAFEFPLDGLRKLLPTARKECAKLKQS